MKTAKENRSKKTSQRLVKRSDQNDSIVFNDNRQGAQQHRSISQVIQQAALDKTLGSQVHPVQRAGEEEEEMGQMKTQEQFAQLKADVAQREPEEEELQKKENPAQLQENKTGLPDNLKTGIENLSGMSMDGVKVHQNSSKPAEVGAHAYAQGTDIHVAPGQMKHLTHEAWHVVQQAQGRVKPTTEVGGMPVNDDVSLEREADVMGDKANNTN